MPPTPTAIRQSIADLDRGGPPPKTIARLLRLPRHCVDAWSDASDNDPNLSNPTTATLDGLRPFPGTAASEHSLLPPSPTLGGRAHPRASCSAAAPSDNTHAATVRRWLRQAGLAAPTPPDTPDRVPHATEPHQIWQMDAAEQVPLRTPAALLVASSVGPADARPVQPGLRPTQLNTVGARGGAGGVAAGLQPLGAAGGLTRR